MKKLMLSIAATLCFTAIISQTSNQLQQLDSYYSKSFQEWNIPGMAIAIVNKDSIVFTKGYGYADLESQSKVDSNTLFAIASNTKAFTASALAQLVEQGKLDWNDKVIDHLPYYRLYDDYTTQNITIEDLLSHRNGLKTFSGDLLWFASTKNPEEIIAAQQHLKPISPFRTEFGYSNISYLAAGEIIEKVTDTSWADYVSLHFLKPLKMDRTLTSVEQLKDFDNAASPYFYENGKNHKIKWTNWDNIAPAGALISSVNDHAKWLILNLNKGTFNGMEFFKNSSFNNLTTPRINHFVVENQEGTNFKAYGLGWSLKDYQGYKTVGHSGGYDGMISESVFVPEKGIGVVVLTNNLNWLTGAIINKSLDVLLADNLEGKDWSKLYLGYKTRQDSIAKVKNIENEKLRGKLQGKHLDFNEYAGIYKDDMYGTTTISKKGEQLFMSMDETPIFKAELNHWNNDIFTFRFDSTLVSLPEGKLWFDLDKNGKVIKLHIDIPNPDFYFTEFEFVKQ